MNIYLRGTKIWFDGERHAYVVQACDNRYLICTKPYNVKHTVLYTIVDLEDEIRGYDDQALGMNYETREACVEILELLQAGCIGISHRNQVPLKIKRTEWRRT